MRNKTPEGLKHFSHLVSSRASQSFQGLVLPKGKSLGNKRRWGFHFYGQNEFTRGKEKLVKSRKAALGAFWKKVCEMPCDGTFLREMGGNIISVIHAILGHAAEEQITKFMAGNAGNERTRQLAAPSGRADALAYGLAWGCHGGCQFALWGGRFAQARASGSPSESAQMYWDRYFR